MPLSCISVSVSQHDKIFNKQNDTIDIQSFPIRERNPTGHCGSLLDDSTAFPYEEN